MGLFKAFSAGSINIDESEIRDTIAYVEAIRQVSEADHLTWEFEKCHMRNLAQMDQWATWLQNSAFRSEEEPFCPSAQRNRDEPAPPDEEKE